MPFTNDKKIMLEGLWSVDRAAELHRFLADRLSELLQGEPVAETVEVDLAEVSGLDVCGCQLLALFMEELRRHGITPVPSALNQQSLDQIALLGFSELLAVHPANP